MAPDPLDADVRDLAERVRSLAPEDRIEFRPALYALLRAADSVREQRAELAAEVRRLRRILGSPGTGSDARHS